MLQRLSTSLLAAGGKLATSRRTPLIAAAVLAAVLGWQLGALIWLAMPQAGAERTLAPVSAGTGSTARSPQAESGGRRPVAEGLFGQASAGQENDTSAQEPEQAPETQLNLTLRGVLRLGAGNGFAFIVAGSGDESVYSPGDPLPGDATLERVYRDRVLLSRRGALETLRLEREGSNELASSRQQRGATPPEDFDREAASETARALRARLRERPADLMRMVQFEPYRQNGDLRGFRLQPRGDVNERVLRGLGLTPDDIVTAINGIPLSDRSRLGEVPEVLGTADEARVRFLRDGEARRINIPMGGSG